MGRYTGAVCKLCRREGVKLFLKGARCLGPKCGVERHAYPPGQHGQGRKKVSDYGLQLREKQKTRRFYGIYEKQFRSYYDSAVKQGGVTGEGMLQFLEMRLDNVIFRSGLVPSRAEARQLITHRHFQVNGQVVNVPSYQVKPDMVIEVREKSRNCEVFQHGGTIRRMPGWLSVDSEAKRIHVLSVPGRQEMDVPDVHEQLVVEYYSR